MPSHGPIDFEGSVQLIANYRLTAAARFESQIGNPHPIDDPEWDELFTAHEALVKFLDFDTYNTMRDIAIERIEALAETNKETGEDSE